MWLAVDSGNTRIKWALMDGYQIIASSSATSTAFAELKKMAKTVSDCRVSQVGPVATTRRLERALAGCRRVYFIRPRRCTAGVTNDYRPPSSLGADRWLCLLAARRQTKRAVVVVSVGTAVTVDGLSATGNFIGGLILPGVRLMSTVLATTTPLPLPPGLTAALAVPPRRTTAAMTAGATLAAAGAILMFRRRYLPRASVLLTGGDAEYVLPALPMARREPNLLFTGMACLREADA